MDAARPSASPVQAPDLVAELKNFETFGRPGLVPRLAANQAGYDPLGGYWRGPVWGAMFTMVIQGLEKYGYSDLASGITLNHPELVAGVYENTGTTWENYSADHAWQGKQAIPDFVGMSGIGSIFGVGHRTPA